MTRENKVKTVEQRRLRGGRLLLKGVSQAEVARRLGVSTPTVYVWKRRLETGGTAALKDQPRGRPPGLTGLNSAQRKRLAGLLKKGALSQGYATNVWTLSRIGRLIVRKFGLEYSDGRISRILVEMGWSFPQPK